MESHSPQEPLQIPDLPEIQDPIRALVAAVTHTTDPSVLHPNETAHALAMYRSGIFAPVVSGQREGDVNAVRYERAAGSATMVIRHTLTARSEHTPLTILRGVRAVAIKTRWGTASGVKLDDKSQVDASTIVTGLDASDGVRVDGTLTRQNVGVHTLAAAREYTVHLIVGTRVLPVGMALRSVIVGDPGQPHLGDNLVLVTRTPLDPEVERISLTTRIPIGTSLKQRKETLRGAIERLRRIAPFLGDDLRGVFPPLDTPHDLPTDQKQADPWTIMRGPVAQESMPPGPFPYGRFRTPIKHLFRTGAATLPGFGYVGEVFSGLAAGRFALKAIGSK